MNKKTDWKTIVESYTQELQPRIKELQELIKKERPEGGYKTLDDVQPETLARIKNLKEFCNFFDIPLLEQLKQVM
jgi:N12 class adenine-specific DNA methylase